MANWSPFCAHFYGDDLLLSHLFQQWRETDARKEPGAELTRLDNPFAMDGERLQGAIFHLDLDNRRFCLRGVGKWHPPIDWLRSLTAAAPIACALDYRNPDDNVDHLVLIVNNETHPIYSVKNEQTDHVEFRGTVWAFVARLPRPPESRALRIFDDESEA